MKALLGPIFMFMSCAAFAQDILILGEYHDNPHHHARQAEEVTGLMPGAIVFEMLTTEQVDGERLDSSDAGKLEARLRWGDSGWPDFSMYYPIFAAAPEATIYGAGVPRSAAMTALQEGAAAFFGAEASLYGLTEALADEEQAQREALQFAAHCDAMPIEMMSGMVEVQRLRDAELARTALRAYRETGGPVAVITGNGHARRDWGMPRFIERVTPGLDVIVIGQTEENAPLEGEFDRVVSAPSIDRADPCDAFK